MRPTVEVDVAVVGAGAAGLYGALSAARLGARVVLISATPLAQTASYWAQGGLAAALSDEDGWERHLDDTERAGRGAVRHSAAEVLVREAPECVADLQALGVHFDGDRFGRPSLGLEGGHSLRRVVHAGGSATGRRVVRQLSALVAEEESISIFEGARASGLRMADGRVRAIVCEGGAMVGARAVILSTGGAAALWARTTNPPGSLGHGLALAHAAGADLADLEFMQFHPTAVTGVPGREGFLVTEAIRGEGATLHDRGGERFVDELAPRDEVSWAIQQRLQATGASAVGLDMRAIDPARFPNVFNALREAGLDPTRELVPVAPAAHYMMGGVVTDLSGRSTVAGLYAVGEASCTGLHGANRLASNSLSECFVFARRAARRAVDEAAWEHGTGIEGKGTDREIGGLGEVAPATREALWRHAAIERCEDGLTELGRDDNVIARLIGASALARRESRGAHRRREYPEADPERDREHVVIGPSGNVRWERWD